MKRDIDILILPCETTHNFYGVYNKQIYESIIRIYMFMTEIIYLGLIVLVSTKG